ncbi:MAG: LD-carboxypeptidase [Ignavibacteriae bacterium]|nr:LD-carboxypeptidase [Ignavibacteriota bacterium]
MSSPRRTFLKQLGVGAAIAAMPHRTSTPPDQTSIIKPKRIKAGDTIGLINPAGPTFEADDILVVKESLAALGLRSKVGKHALDRYGYLAGSDAARAEDVNAMFEDDGVDAIITIRGGWGCNRILHLLDYEMIRKHPKIICGYSDITSLLVALYARTGLVTFHGPVGTSTWNKFSLDYFKRVLFDGEQVTMVNPKGAGDNLAQTKDRIQAITKGKARGRLVGGNLSVLTAMIGSRYLPDWSNHILFLEETGENIYRVDRMVTQLKLAGVLDKLAGFVFGKCTSCEPAEGYASLTLEEVFIDHIKPLGIPALYGAMIGHIENKFTVPVGIEAEIDAESGTIRLLESAVL